MVLLNNDLSAGPPAILQDIDQPIAPPLQAGWYNRKKSHHFARLRRASPKEFARAARHRPWLINPYFGVCGEIDFQERAGEECLASNVDDRCSSGSAPSTRNTASSEKPFVIVKADAGTYGMGIMTVRDAAEVSDLNRKQRNKMAVVKEGLRGDAR